MYTYPSPRPMESFLVDTGFYQSMLHTMYFGKLKECGLLGEINCETTLQGRGKTDRKIMEKLP